MITLKLRVLRAVTQCVKDTKRFQPRTMVMEGTGAVEEAVVAEEAGVAEVGGAADEAGENEDGERDEVGSL
jgi:hypothetical protein